MHNETPLHIGISTPSTLTNMDISLFKGRQERDDYVSRNFDKLQRDGTMVT